jgi:uncharacterized protein YjbI with pentapeptide repeats
MLDNELAREQALQGFLNRVAALRADLYEHSLRPQAAAWMRAEALALLPSLDGLRKGRIVRFLYELGLLGCLDPATQQPLPPVVKLDGADLRDLQLPHANLGWIHLVACFLDRANFAGSYLGGANLGASDLPGADLSHATLTGSNLYLCDLRGANLSGADLTEARVTEAQLAAAQTSPAAH